MAWQIFILVCCWIGNIVSILFAIHKALQLKYTIVIILVLFSNWCNQMNLWELFLCRKIKTVSIYQPGSRDIHDESKQDIYTLSETPRTFWKVVDYGALSSLLWIFTILFENDILSTLYEYPALQDIFLYHFLLTVPILILIFYFIESSSLGKKIHGSMILFSILTLLLMASIVHFFYIHNNASSMYIVGIVSGTLGLLLGIVSMFYSNSKNTKQLWLFAMFNLLWHVCIYIMVYMLLH